VHGDLLPASRLPAGEYIFIKSLHSQLKNLLEAEGIEVSVWIDSRPSNDQNEPWPELKMAAAERRFDALILPAQPHLEWSRKLPIPVVGLGAVASPCTVAMDRSELFRLGLDGLVARNCRSVGLIHPTASRLAPPDETANEWGAEVQRFVEEARQRDLEVQDAWLRVGPGVDDPATLSTARSGYREFQALWEHTERPDGILIGDDIIAGGVIAAILEARLSVPGDLQLVSQKNRHVDLFCPFPIGHVVLDEREIAAALLEQIRAQFGRRAERGRTIAFTLES